MDNKKTEYGHAEYMEDKPDSASGTNTPPLDAAGQAVFRPRMTPQEKQVALAAATAADPGVPVASARFALFLLTILTVCLCGGDSGLDATVMSAVNSMTQYKKYFGISPTQAARTGIVFGIYTVGNVCAFVPSAILPDKIGRKWSMIAGNSVLVLGALLTANATSMPMFLGGRFLTGFGCTTAANTAKSYVSEMTSPKSRGLYMGTLNSFYYVGQILASGVSIPTGRMASNWAWRTPMMIQVIPASINAIGMLFCYESPRWLYAHGKREEAVQILARYHSRDNDINSPMVRLQVSEIEEAISLDGADKRWWDFRRLFNSGPNRYRLFCAILLSIYGQLSGNGLITYYLPSLLQGAGITNTDRQRVLNFVNSVTSMIGAGTGTAVVDYFGRRKLLLFALITCMSWLVLVTILLSPVGKKSTARSSAGIACIYLFMVFFSVGITPLQGLYPAEVFSYENRAKGLSLQSLCTSAVSCINTFALPTALLKLSWKTYIIFAVWDFLGIFIVYFTMVETKRLSLEEIDSVFNSGNFWAARCHSIELAKHNRQIEKEQKAALADGA